jgi:drug/metabolite transporter (DMT)-like permease
MWDYIKGYLAIMITVVAWGISFLNTKIALQALEPMTLALGRFSIALLILTIIAKMMGRKLRIKKEDYLLFLLAGGIGITVYFYFENNGVKYISPSAASLIIASLPVFTMFSEAIIYKMKLSLKMIFSGILSVAGVIIIVSSDFNLTNILDSGESIGYLMMIGAIISWVIYSLATKELFKKYDQLTITYYQFVFGLIMFLPLTFFEDNRWEAFNSEVLINVLILGIFASTIGFFMYNYAMNELGVSKASLFVNFIPLVTVIASYFYYGSLIGIRQIIGGILIIISVLITRKKRDKTKETIEEKQKSAIAG